MLKGNVSCTLLAFEAKVGKNMAEPKKKLRFSFKVGICLLLICAVIFVPWAYTQRKKAYTKADECLVRRRDKIKSYSAAQQEEIERAYEDMRWTALEDYAFQQYLDGVEGYSIDSSGGYIFHIENQEGGSEEYTISRDGDAFSAVEDIEGGADQTHSTELDEPEAYYDDDGVLRYFDGEEVPSFLYLDDEGHLMLDEACILSLADDTSDDIFYYGFTYIDEDGDTCQVKDLDPKGYRFQETMVYDEALDTFLVNPPEPKNEMSRENQTLMKAVNEIELKSETIGSSHGYRYAVFFVQGLAYVEYPDAQTDETYVRILDLTDTDQAISEIKSPDGSMNYRILHVVIFEDMAPYLRAWRLDMLKHGCMLLLLCAIVVLSLFLYEKRTEALERLDQAEEESLKETEESVEDSPEVPYEESVSKETARVLIAQIRLAEQSMGPNPYLDKLRDDIHDRSGKRDEEQEQ